MRKVWLAVCAVLAACSGEAPVPSPADSSPTLDVTSAGESALALAAYFDHSALRDEFSSADASDGVIDGQAQHLTSAVCARCHPGQLDEILATVHYTFRSENPNIDYPGGGRHGHYDRGSGITGGTTTLNFTYEAEHGCGRCHVGKYLPGTVNEIDLLTGLPTPGMDLVRDGIDCLVCHATRYNGRDRMVPETGGDGQTRLVWRQDRTWEAVASIGRTTTDACLRCHREAQSPNERGTPFEPWNDVHLASTAFNGNACTHCHPVARHKMPRGNHVSELFASDHPVGSAENDVLCQRCHGAAPHGVRQLNEHTAWIACQTCHVPWTSGLTYARWEPDGRRTAFARNDMYGAIDSTPYVVDGLQTAEAWERYRMRPKYLWFDGRSSFLAQPAGGRSDGASKIWPFKPLSSGLPFDASGLSMADMLDDATLQRALVGTGAMIPGEDPRATAVSGVGTLGNRTLDSSLSVEMQAEMRQTPLLLNMDLSVLDATHDLGASIAAGMRRNVLTLNAVGRLLGAASDSPLVAVFDGQHPGSAYRIEKFPTGENMQARLGPAYPSASYLTLTHGVRSAAEALSCRDCHRSDGVLERNKFEVFVGRDASGAPVFREANNSEVLGYGPTGLRK